MNLVEHIRHWLSKPDLKTPVFMIVSSLNELKKETALSEHGKKSLATALVNADRLKELLSHPKDIKTDVVRDKEAVLLVEAKTDMEESLRKNLSLHYEVTSVDNGNSALELARETNPDIIIAEAVMPGVSGYELCRILKSAIETSHIPIILLSALNEKENIIFGLEAGANDYIVKPFDSDILKARIRNILQNREQLRKIVFSPHTSIEGTSYTNELDIEFLDKAIGIVEKEIDNSEFSINELCSMLAMSRTSVYNKLKSLTNQAPNDFIRIIRLNKAKDFLASGKYTVSEVSYRVGFTDPKYFSTSFKKQFGVSPSKLNNGV